MSSGSGIVLTESPEGRADLRLAIPPVNVLGAADLAALAARLGALREARVVVLSGLPRAFSAGVSVAEHAPDPAAIDAMLGAMRAALTALVSAPAVTIASVSGACLGGGAELAAACDLVIAAEDARIGFPEIRLACFPPAAAVLLAHRIGVARANDWILTGRVLSGREAADAGFAGRAVPAASLRAETDRLAADLLLRSPAAVGAVREVLRTGRRRALSADLPAAEEAYRALAGDPDLAAAVRAFGKGR